MTAKEQQQQQHEQEQLRAAVMLRGVFTLGMPPDSPEVGFWDRRGAGAAGGAGPHSCIGLGAAACRGLNKFENI